MTLNPGESTIIALDLKDSGEGIHVVDTDAAKVQLENGQISLLATASGTYHATLSDGTEVSAEIAVPEAVSLPVWDITIVDWNEGDKVINTEEKFGHTTTEVYYETKRPCFPSRRAS